MPQMMPYKWTLIFFFTLMFLIMIINMNYFFYFPSFFNQNNMNMYSKKFTKWIWKW